MDVDEPQSPFSVRLGSVRRVLDLGALIADESRGAFIRHAVQERADRLLNEARTKADAADEN